MKCNRCLKSINSKEIKYIVDIETETHNPICNKCYDELLKIGEKGCSKNKKKKKLNAKN